MTKKKFLFWAVIIAFIHIGLVILFGTQKQGFHEDEYYTYWSVSSEHSLNPANFSWNTGYGLQSRFFVKEGQQFSFDMVVHNQEEDVHPPLYYLALHVFMSFFANSFYKWFGIILNLLFSLITYACILFIFYRISGDTIPHRKLLALFAGFIYAIAPSTISSVMLARMYAMSTMWTALYGVVFLLLMQSKQYSRRKFALLVLSGAAVCYCAFLTHYFALLVPFFLTAAYCLYTLAQRKGIVRMLIYGASMLVAILLAVCTYPACISHIFSGYRGTDAMEGLFSSSLFERTMVFIGYMNEFIFAKMLTPCIVVFLICAILGIVMLVRRKSKEGTGIYIYQMVSLGITCLLSFWLLTRTALIAGEASCRYFYPVIALVLPYMAYTIAAVLLSFKDVIIEQKWFSQTRKLADIALSGIFLVILIVPLFCGYYQQNVSFLYEDNAEKKAFSEEYSAYPVIMVYSSYNSYRSWYVDDQLWPFENVFYADVDHMQEITDERLLTSDKIVVYMDAPEEYLQTLIDDNPNLDKYSLVRHDPFFYVYLLE